MLSVWEIFEAGKPVQVALSLHENSLDEVSRLLPQGLYSTFRTFVNCTRILDLRHHLDRLYQPATALGIRPSVGERELRQTLRELLAVYQPGEARVRVSLSTQSRPGAMFAAIEPLQGLSEQVYQRGVRVVMSQTERINPTLKSTFFLQESEQARKTLSESGAFEGLMAYNGRILEGLTSNFYYFKDGALGTAKKGILPGVTRRLVLSLARRAGVTVVYRALMTSQLGEISEAFITSSSRGIVPIVLIDNLQVGQGTPGPITRQLMERYNACVEKRARPI